MEWSKIEIWRSSGATAGGSEGRGTGFESSTLMLLTSDEEELAKEFIFVNKRLISLTDTKCFFSSSTISRLRQVWVLTWRVLL